MADLQIAAVELGLKASIAQRFGAIGKAIVMIHDVRRTGLEERDPRTKRSRRVNWRARGRAGGRSDGSAGPLPNRFRFHGGLSVEKSCPCHGQVTHLPSPS